MMNIDNNTLLLLMIVSFALVAIAGFWFFQRRGKVKVQGLLGTSLELEGSNKSPAPPPAAKVSFASSRSGRLTAQDQTGRGVKLNRVGVEGSITAMSIPGEPYPKARPPVRPGAWLIRPR